MSKYKYSKTEQQINKVLIHQSGELAAIEGPCTAITNDLIAKSEEHLINLGYEAEIAQAGLKINQTEKKIMFVPSWENLSAEAERTVSPDGDIESLFTAEELKQNEQAIRMLKAEYNALHKLDKVDVFTSAAAGLLGAAVDILLVGIPKRSPDGLKAGPLSNFIRKSFDERFPAGEMEKLANSKLSKVSYDAQDNRHTKQHVEGLSAYYHRLLSLGHDPLLGLIFGVLDIISGTMTTIDKTGKITSQVMKVFADRKESDIFAAIAKQISHFKSDITTSMGLPAPLMGLFNLLQFGSIGEENQTIAEIVQGMYYEGYDFIHFCSQSIPVMIVEVVIRLGYAIKRIKEGHALKDSIPFSLNRETNPKLATMLFIGHSASTAINAGKLCFTKDPMAINYPQWLTFAKYSYQQLEWALVKKPEARDAYILGNIKEELTQLYASVDSTFEVFSKDHIVVFE